jgi:hypothetical protein
VRVGERGVRNEIAGQQEVASGGDEVSGFIPKIGKSKHGSVKNEYGAEDEREHE